jgi:hypothetical protein
MQYLNWSVQQRQDIKRPKTNPWPCATGMIPSKMQERRIDTVESHSIPETAQIKILHPKCEEPLTQAAHACLIVSQCSSG